MPASAAAPSGSQFVRPCTSTMRSRVAREHLDIGEQVVGERHRLRHLQVREAGQDRVGVLIGQRRPVPAAGRRAGRRASRSRRAATGARRSRPGRCANGRCAGACPASPTRCDEARLDVEVHVLEIDAPVEAAAFDLFGDLRQAAPDGREVGRRDDVAVGEHRRVRQAAGDVGAPESMVEADAGRVALDQLARRLREQGRPRFGLLLELIG